MHLWDNHPLADYFNRLIESAKDTTVEKWLTYEERYKMRKLWQSLECTADASFDMYDAIQYRIWVNATEKYEVDNAFGEHIHQQLVSVLQALLVWPEKAYLMDCSKEEVIILAMLGDTAANYFSAYFHVRPLTVDDILHVSYN